MYALYTSLCLGTVCIGLDEQYRDIELVKMTLVADPKRGRHVGSFFFMDTSLELINGKQKRTVESEAKRKYSK